MQGGRREWRTLVRMFVLVAGLLLFGAGGWMTWAGFRSDRTAPYRYVLGATLSPTELGPLAPWVGRGSTVRRAIVVERTGNRNRPLADLQVADGPHGRVLVRWNAQVDEPFLYLLPPFQEVAAVAAALKRHVSPDTTVLAWWDVSRQFRLMAGVKTAFDGHLQLPLFVPPEWVRRRAGVQEAEGAFWRPHLDGGQRKRFLRFVNALLSRDDSGIAELHRLVGGGRAVLVLHVRDVILLGKLFPRRLGVAFQDLPVRGDLHGLIRTVKDWVERNHYPAYTIAYPDPARLRVIALTDSPSSATLSARLLPFVGGDPGTVRGTTLVYQAGGFWVYELSPFSAVDRQGTGGYSEASSP